MKRLTKRYWFRAKTYGYGWVPATVEGWVVMIVYFIVVIGYSGLIDQKMQSVSQTLLEAVPLWLGATVALLVICYLTGESPHWRWGKEK